MSRCVLVSLLLVAAVWVAEAETYLVLPDGSGDFPNIQAAVDAATNGDVILLSDGTFTGDGNRDIDFDGKAITVRSLSDDPVSCTVDCQGNSSAPHRGFRFDSGETASSVLQGLTVMNGYTAGSFPENDGAGVYCEGSSPAITNCVFTENAAQSGAGVLCYDFASPTLTNCIFSRNQASARTIGAGVYCHFYASPHLNGCSFIENSPDGMYAHATSSPQLDGCSFSGHSSRGFGCHGGSPSIVNCYFADNSGHALELLENSPAISGCTFADNSAAEGAALYLDWDFAGTVVECCFYNNTVTESGAAVWCGSGSPSFVNCTMAYNVAGSGAGGIDCGSATVTLENTIIAFSTGGHALDGNATLSCCDLYGNAGGDWIGDIAGQYGVNGNISEDPLFCDLMSDDFTIQEDSPCAAFSSPNPECDLIGSEPIGCPPPAAIWPPVETASWGGVKALFREGTD
ncbi:MAG: right-handed parallel beta-helix repeat-containing protein [Candidatus Eisenbacteria sp.]|nr:right-handed parallel beta-helix repeat-containing protein [Candidatus Eisenbacteria bacterium]